MVKPAAATAAATAATGAAKRACKTRENHEASLHIWLKTVKIGTCAPTCATLGPWQNDEPSDGLLANSAARPYLQSAPPNTAKSSYLDA
jgi:hypothetical protein